MIPDVFALPSVPKPAPVICDASPRKLVAVIIPLALPNLILLPTFKSLPTTFTPALAVIIPIESTFVTSSYVNTPPTFKLPVNVPLAAFIAPENVPVVNVDAVPVNPFGKFGAPFAPAFVIVPARIRPPVAALAVEVLVRMPKTSGMKVSPSATMKSASSVTTKSW